MEQLRLELHSAPGYAPHGPKGPELEAIMATSAERSSAVIDALVKSTEEVRVSASMDSGACKGEWCAADRIEQESLYAVVRELGGTGKVTRREDGTAADGQWEAWGHRHIVDVTLSRRWSDVRARWKVIAGTASSWRWAVALAGPDGLVVTRRAWSRLLDIDAGDDVLDELCRRFPEWNEGRNHRVACALADASSRLLPRDDAVRLAQNILEGAGWTDLRVLEVKHVGKGSTWWPWPDSGNEMVVLFAGTVPRTGERKYAYRDPPDRSRS